LIRLLYNEGAQVVRCVPVDSWGRPTRVSSPTCEIVDLRYSETSSERSVLASGAATVEAGNTTLSAAAGPSQVDPKLLTVASVTGFTQGRQYLVSKSDGQRELFTAARIDSGGLKIYALTELQFDYASSDLVQAVELECSFPAVEANDDDNVRSGGGPYQVTWEYTIAGIKYRQPEQIWLGRYSTFPFITESDLTQVAPHLPGRARNRLSLHTSIVCATQDFVAELEASGRDPTEFRASTAGKVACRNRALTYLLRWMGTERDDALAEYYDAEWRRLMGNMLTGRPDIGVTTVRKSDDMAKEGHEKLGGHAFIRVS
jgi:hypothetical protein